MDTILLAASLIVATALAQDPICTNSGLTSIGAGGPAAGIPPNETNTITFRTSNGTIQWRTNVTGIANSQGQYTVDTEYDFQWPGGGSLQDFISSSAPEGPQSLCITVVDLSGLPSNISSVYQQSDNGDCTAVLGSACLDAIRSNLGDGNSASGCQASAVDIHTSQCASTLGLAQCSSVSASLLSDDSSLGGLQSGDGIFSQSNSVSSGSDVDAAVEKAAEQLQMLVLTGFTTQILCQRINQTPATSTSPSPTTPSSQSGSSAAPSQTSVGASSPTMRSSLAGVGAVLLLAAF